MLSMMPILVSFLIWSLATFASSIKLQNHEAPFMPDFVLSLTQELIHLGGMQRLTTVVNGSTPGPAIRLPENRVTWIRVYNNMIDTNATIHWHGLGQAAYPFSDGTPLAGQWPIPPGHYFDYELLPPSGSAGSYYYHGHVGFSTSTATGPLIVEDPGQPPYEYAEERTVFIQEYWNQTDDAILRGLTANPLRWPGQPKGWLINGHSISNWEADDESTRNLAVIDVEPGKKYRFRFVTATALSVALFAFENHTDWTIIAADGSFTEEQPVELFQMGSGQRYDALFQAKSCSQIKEFGKLDFYIQLETRERTPTVTNYAILRYNNTCGADNEHRVSEHENPPIAPLSLPPTDTDYLELLLKPLEDNDFPTAKEVTRRIFLDQQQVFDGYVRWQINNNTWQEEGDVVQPYTIPRMPYLVALYENREQFLPDYNAAIKNSGLDPKTKTYPAKIGEVLEIVLQNKGARATSGGLVAPGDLDTHPWHHHGSHVYDIGSGRGEYDPDVAESQLQGKRPVRRDTTMLYKHVDHVEENEIVSWRAWRLRVDDPGVWMVHCHTLQHMIQGMQTVWIHGEAKDVMKLGYLDVEGYLTYGGDVYGNVTHTPRRIVHFNERTEL